MASSRSHSGPRDPDVGQEVVDHRVQGQDGDVEAVLGDEREQQVERALELLEADREAGAALDGRVPGVGRAARPGHVVDPLGGGAGSHGRDAVGPGPGAGVGRRPGLLGGHRIDHAGTLPAAARRNTLTRGARGPRDRRSDEYGYTDKSFVQPR